MSKLQCYFIGLILGCAICATAPARAQTIAFGNSEVAYAPWQYSGIPSVIIRGHLAMTCQQLYAGWLLVTLIGQNPKTMILVLATNDVRMGTAVAQHMACVTNTLAFIHSAFPATKIVLTNTPPWQQTNCYGDARSLIADYNAAYAALAQDQQYQGWMTLADVWTGFASPQTQWAYPPLMSGLCGIHFGMPGQLNMGWSQFFMRLRGAMEK